MEKKVSLHTGSLIREYHNDGSLTIMGTSKGLLNLKGETKMNLQELNDERSRSEAKIAKLEGEFGEIYTRLYGEALPCMDTRLREFSRMQDQDELFPDDPDIHLINIARQWRGAVMGNDTLSFLIAAEINPDSPRQYRDALTAGY